MQSEIDDIRLALTGLGILRDADRLNADEVDSFIGFVSKRLDLIELQQAPSTVSVLNVVRLADLVPSRPRPHLHVVVEGERA
jgi:hypothetical protein